MTAHLVELARALRPGDPRADFTTLCRLVDDVQLAVVREHVHDAVRRVADGLTGARRVNLPGPWYAPTVLGGWTAQMLVMTRRLSGR